MITKRKILLIISYTIAAQSWVTTLSFAATAKRDIQSPEIFSKEISKKLKAISDEEWEQIKKGKTFSEYTVVAGDNLYTIATKLFENAALWPKVWALNGDRIKNPHDLKPGLKLRFIPMGPKAKQTSSGQRLADATNQQDVTGLSSSASDAKIKVTAEPQEIVMGDEWKLLPSQPWEQVSLPVPPEVDPQGFDRRSKVVTAKPSKLSLEYYAESSRLDTLGIIRGSTSLNEFLSTGDTVFIEPYEDVSMNSVYELTEEPFSVKNGQSSVGLAYPKLGKVRLIKLADNMIVGKIIEAKHPISRKAVLINSLVTKTEFKPVATKETIEATIVPFRENQDAAIAEDQQVFITAGTSDGVEPGNVFRIFQYDDPFLDKVLLDSRVIQEADIYVVQVSEDFSAGIVIRGTGINLNPRHAISLTDVSEFQILKKTKVKDWDKNNKEKEDELDELDKLDQSEEIGEGEKQELEQLEKHTEDAAPFSAPTTEPGTEATPDSLLPPTADENAPTETPPPTTLPNDAELDAPTESTSSNKPEPIQMKSDSNSELAPPVDAAPEQTTTPPAPEPQPEAPTHSTSPENGPPTSSNDQPSPVSSSDPDIDSLAPPKD